ncbi:MAG: sugar ABC transporter substrate-binding protein, partial [Eubacteriales bacterium]|nr:sugar ABC transporter substrate-binding protein [Eubacteriales bacterium]
MKKKVLALMTVVALAGVMMVGCGAKKTETEAPATEAAATEAVTEAAATEAETKAAEEETTEAAA